MEEIYGPEDIEKLLLCKDFSDLYPEERDYVLRHMDGEEEYSAMRLMLLDVSATNDELTPPVSMREELIAMHESRYKTSGFKIWLNSLFSALVPKLEWQRPAMQLAGIAGIILLVVVVYRTLTPGIDSVELAFEPAKIEEPSAPIQQEEFDSTEPELPNGSDNSIAEIESIVPPVEMSESNGDNEETIDNAVDDRIDRSSSDEAADKFTDVTPQKQVIELIADEKMLADEIVVLSQEAEAEEESDEIDELAGQESFEMEDMAMDDEVVVQSDNAYVNAPSSSEMTAAAVRLEGNDLTTIAAARVPHELLSHLFTAW